MLSAGTKIGSYEILNLLGSGGMGDVYRGRDAALRRDVAIKILPDSISADPDRLTRFGREARVLASLNHPNIATIYGFEQTADVRAIVLELIDGETLAERISRGPLAMKEAIRIARDVAGALDAAHEKGIIHRDLKPANVMLTRNGVVKVLDFGLAKAADESHMDGEAAGTRTDTGTRAGIALGTPAYMSPEQTRGQSLGTRADLWSMGCVLFEMLTGGRAFAGATVADTIGQILEREPEWSALPEATPPRVRHLLQRCLEKDTKDRWRDAGDLRIELDDVLRSLGGEMARGTAAPRSIGQWRWLERGAWIVALAAMAALAATMSRTPSRDPTVPRQAIAFHVAPPPGMTFSFEGGAPWPSISPDGRHLAFVAVSTSGEQGLWIRSLDQADARPVRGTAGAYRPFWSPDSRSLAYFGDGRLWRVDLPGGAPHQLAAAPYSGRLKGTWGRDAILITLLTGIYRVPPTGGSATLLTLPSDQPQGPTPVDSISFLPGGERFFYLVGDSQQQKPLHCVGFVDPKAPTCGLAVNVPMRYAEPGYVMFVQDGALRAQPFDLQRLALGGQALPITDTRFANRENWYALSFSASENGVLAYHPNTGEAQLVWFDRSGATKGRIDSIETNGDASLSSDGKRVLFGHVNAASGTRDLWLHEIDHNRSSRFTVDATVDTRAIFSPDGRRVVFKAIAESGTGLYVKDVAGISKESLIAPVPASAIPKDWSFDGKYILYQASHPKTGWDLWVVPASGTGSPRAVVNTDHGEREGRFSPDGRWIAYDSSESGRREIWVQPLPPTGTKWQVSSTGGFSPRWRKDGKELFYIATDGRMMAVAITLGNAATFDTPRPLFQTMLRDAVYGAYEVTADGERFLINVPPDGRDATPITVVMNWMERLRR